MGWILFWRENPVEQAADDHDGVHNRFQARFIVQCVPLLILIKVSSLIFLFWAKWRGNPSNWTRVLTIGCSRLISNSCYFGTGPIASSIFRILSVSKSPARFVVSCRTLDDFWSDSASFCSGSEIWRFSWTETENCEVARQTESSYMRWPDIELNERLISNSRFVNQLIR
jgi:hypothetical protein